MPTTSRELRAPGHVIEMMPRGPFLQPRCSCGWEGAARSSQRLAVTEARDHVILFMPAAPDLPDR